MSRCLALVYKASSKRSVVPSLLPRFELQSHFLNFVNEPGEGAVLRFPHVYPDCALLTAHCRAISNLKVFTMEFSVRHSLARVKFKNDHTTEFNLNLLLHEYCTIIMLADKHAHQCSWCLERTCIPLPATFQTIVLCIQMALVVATMTRTIVALCQFLTMSVAWLSTFVLFSFKNIKPHSSYLPCTCKRLQS